jgi:5'/3'-nucleotidase
MIGFLAQDCLYNYNPDSAKHTETQAKLKMKHFLVTNDDGVMAPGLFALAREMRQLGKVTILAPDHNWSASGHVKTLHRPLRVKEVQLADGTPALASDGAPSDCVALAVLGLLAEKVDLVVSGINSNANLGHDVTYSGTVTAAMEAAIWGLPGIAVSLDLPENNAKTPDYNPAAQLAGQVVRAVIEHGLPKNVLLNVNVPYLPADQIHGLRITRQGLRVYHDLLVRREDPRGQPYYWIGGEAPTGVPEDGTDIGALQQGWASITPLHLDLTAYQAMTELNSWHFDRLD